jgi:hypothetical protein
MGSLIVIAANKSRGRTNENPSWFRIGVLTVQSPDQRLAQPVKIRSALAAKARIRGVSFFRIHHAEQTYIRKCIAEYRFLPPSHLHTSFAETSLSENLIDSGPAYSRYFGTQVGKISGSRILKTLIRLNKIRVDEGLPKEQKLICRC